jgi:hypothetical protein
MEGTEWVCSSQKPVDAKESIIILAAKEVGPQDTFANYENYLKAPKQLQSVNGKSLSQVKSMKTRKINDHQWVDALHLGSEIPGYYTRYVATIKDRLAILVTFSAHQKYFTKYSNDFFKAVESLRVVATKDMFSQKSLAPIKAGTESLGAGINTSLPEGEEAPGSTDSSEAPDPTLLAVIGLVMAAIGAYLWKKRI